MTETADPGHEMSAETEAYVHQMKEQVARATSGAALICVIDSEGNLSASSPMGYSERQVAAMLTKVAEKIDSQCDAAGIPPLEPDDMPGDVPDDARID